MNPSEACAWDDIFLIYLLGQTLEKLTTLDHNREVPFPRACPVPPSRWAQEAGQTWLVPAQRCPLESSSESRVGMWGTDQ